MAELKLGVDLRTGVGKNRVDKLRRDEGQVPGVLYGNGLETRNVRVDKLEFDKIYKMAGESTVIDLLLDGDSIPALIKEVQTHPFKSEYIHIDFQELNMSETVRLTVPVVLINREEVETEELTLMQQLDELEIECLPGDIPQTIEVDVQNMTLDQPVLVQDLPEWDEDKLFILDEGDALIASLFIPTEEVEEDEELEDVDAMDVPVIGEDEAEAEETEE